VAGFVLDFPSNSTIGDARVTIGNATATTEDSVRHSCPFPIPITRTDHYIAGRGVCFVERVDYELAPR